VAVARGAVDGASHPDVRALGRFAAALLLDGRRWRGLSLFGPALRCRTLSAAIHALLPALEAACAAPFNSVLLNRYRSGAEHMGWHADDEPELGPEPVIASLSLGAERRFLLRLRAEPAIKQEWRLGHGDLLLMRGDCQRVAQHALPKMVRVADERINLTFRRVGPRPSPAPRAAGLGRPPTGPPRSAG